jgi:hypothetical protein
VGQSCSCVDLWERKSMGFLVDIMGFLVDISCCRVVACTSSLCIR